MINDNFNEFIYNRLRIIISSGYIQFKHLISILYDLLALIEQKKCKLSSVLALVQLSRMFYLTYKLNS